MWSNCGGKGWDFVWQLWNAAEHCHEAKEYQESTSCDFRSEWHATVFTAFHKIHTIFLVKIICLNFVVVGNMSWFHLRNTFSIQTWYATPVSSSVTIWLNISLFPLITCYKCQRACNKCLCAPLGIQRKQDSNGLWQCCVLKSVRFQEMVRECKWWNICPHEHFISPTHQVIIHHIWLFISNFFVHIFSSIIKYANRTNFLDNHCIFRRSTSAFKKYSMFQYV